MRRSEALAYLYGLERFGMVFGLENIQRLLYALGEPHIGLKVIHVGGTNGKGSVSAMLASALKQSDYRVGLYTSPHLVSFTERIQIDGKEISWDEVIELTEFLRRRVEEVGIPEHYTFFDFTTAMAFYYFAKQRVDIAVVEVGLGGRLDSTNCITPLISVITNVDRDHIQVLGDSIAAIAREKAGIIKPLVPLVSGATQPEVIEILEGVARDKGAPIYLIGRDFWGKRDNSGLFSYQGRGWHIEGLRLGLRGSFQIQNAAVAIAALEALAEERGFVVPQVAIERGLSVVRWPGRMELVDSVPRILLDGAHNPAGARELRSCLEEEGFDYKGLSMVMGVMEDKEVEAIVSELVPLADVVIATAPQNPRALNPAKLGECVRRYHHRVTVIAGVPSALAYARRAAKRDDLIVVTGSLYTVGEARGYLLNEGVLQ